VITQSGVIFALSPRNQRKFKSLGEIDSNYLTYRKLGATGPSRKLNDQVVWPTHHAALPLTQLQFATREATSVNSQNVIVQLDVCHNLGHVSR
jgi:hypothetical protein